MKIYTKTGDEGKTSLFQGPRVLKNHELIQAYGTVDELNATIGIIRAFTPVQEIDQALQHLQNILFDLGADLATPYPEVAKDRFSQKHILALENQIDAWEEKLAPLKNFILPGGCKVSAHLHYARTVCRRAERNCIGLLEKQAINPHSFAYLNRLSDWLFVLARYANKVEQIEDTPWISS